MFSHSGQLRTLLSSHAQYSLSIEPLTGEGVRIVSLRFFQSVAQSDALLVISSRLGYPIIIFSGVSYGESRDRLPQEDQRSSLINITHSRLVFAEVNFSSYYFSAPHAATSPDNVEGFKRGYRDSEYFVKLRSCPRTCSNTVSFSVCRFFGGLIADHEALQVSFIDVSL